MAHISRSHPVRTALDAAANGQALTSSFLDDMLINVSHEHLPDGQNLNTFRGDITHAARDIAALHAAGKYQEARAAAEAAADEIGESMTPEQAALNTTRTRASDAAVEEAVNAAFTN